MANERLNIPEKLKVGFNKRSDTYSGKLAYVTYINDKGEIAKQTSWKNWISKEIDVEDYDNEPIEGFVLNKRVGGYCTGWNHRQTKCRVYDPRGFEVEITVENLLYILQECTSTKGKGLEGKFVYAWDRKDLVLLPVCSEDYVLSTELQNKKEKITIKDLKIGAAYKGKYSPYLIYIGKLDWYFWYYTDDSTGYGYNRHVDYFYKVRTSKLCTFVDTEKGEFVAYKNTNNLDYLLDENAITLDDVETYIENFKTTPAYQTKNAKTISLSPNHNILDDKTIKKRLEQYKNYYTFKRPDDDTITYLTVRAEWYYNNLTLSEYLRLSGWDSIKHYSKITDEKEKELREIFEKNKKLKIKFFKNGVTYLDNEKLCSIYTHNNETFIINEDEYKYLRPNSYDNDSFGFLDSNNNFIRYITNNSLSSGRIKLNKKEKLPQIN